MLHTSRPFRLRYDRVHQLTFITDGARPLPGGAVVLAPLPVGINGQPYNGMDPSDPLTYVRPWRPQPGMVARLNFDGAARQGDTEMGGLWGLPASRDALAGVRPRKRIR